MDPGAADEGPGFEPGEDGPGAVEVAGVRSWTWTEGDPVVRSAGGDLLAGAAVEIRDQVLAHLGEASRLGLPVEIVVEVAETDHGPRWLELRGALAARAGAGLRGVAVDITERHLVEEARHEVLRRERDARDAAERASGRLALLAELSGRLGIGLDPDHLPAEVAATLVGHLSAPTLAEWASVTLLDPRGGPGPSVVRHRCGPEIEGGDLGAAVSAVTEAARTAGRTVAVQLPSPGPDRPGDAVIAAPMRWGGRVLGVVAVGRRAGVWERDDLVLVEDVAARSAAALDAARTFRSRSELASALQRTLLPPVLPRVAGLDLAARYEVAGTGIEIGGDLYDVFAVGETWYVVVGDVCGKGPSAAALTGLVRHTVRAVAASVAEGRPSPAEVLGQTSAALADQVDETGFATVVLAAVEPGPTAARVRIACGGHPRPVLVRPGRPAVQLSLEGSLLGVLDDPGLVDVDLVLDDGCALVLFTDGVTEARHGVEQMGEARVLAALDARATAAPPPSAAQLADAVLDAVHDFRDASSSVDDIAVVVVAVSAE